MPSPLKYSIWLCWRLTRSDSSQGREDNLWRQWNRGNYRTEWLECIIHRVSHRGGCSRRARLAGALRAQLRLRGRCHHVSYINIGHFAGHRNQVIGHIGVSQLAAPIIDAFLEQRCTEALHHAAPDLLVDQLRIDDRAAILDHPMPEQLDEASIGVNFKP